MIGHTAAGGASMTISLLMVCGITRMPVEVAVRIPHPQPRVASRARMCNHQLRMAGRLPRNHAPRHARAPPDGDRATHIEGDTDMSTTKASRRLIAAMQMTLDGYSLGPSV